ncbi:MAG: threonylcarbamoyl-AMP synthase [Chitinophagaceae bacterium]|nr:MAG: Sua5/YciO/YrdC/YwlC family protein [Bacteroidetes bacterium OLB11]MCC6447945.1 threonylcarbamoyl-AMP synthase [Chitinophagaceae bacterium]HMN33395.1 L-threonylcarbamoyladenylate synthase [Chitinophagaceae bacterium]
MIIDIHPINPDERKIKQVTSILKSGGIIIYPTDTVYGMGCDITHPEAIERICHIKKLNPKKAQLSFLCSDLSHLSLYCKAIDTPLYRFLKENLPGPFTFILNASKQVPKLLRTKKDTVGIRVPENKICNEILKELGNPIISTSLPFTDEEYTYTDAEEIHAVFKNQVDLIINGGEGGHTPSTVVDCTVSPPQVIREGKGELF